MDVQDRLKLTKENFTQWNEEMVKKYGTILESQTRHSNAIVRYIEGLRVRWVVRYVNANENDIALDVGCGGGNILEKIKAGKLYGIDLSETLLVVAKKRLGDRATLLNGDAEDMAKLFPNKKFSKIFSSEVIEHLLRPEAMISEIYKLIDTNGIVVISIPNEKVIKAVKRVLIVTGLFKLLFAKRKEEAEYEWHLHDFDLTMLQKLIQGKFVVQKIKRIPFWFFPLRYVVRMSPIK
ncbi:MAG: methyltransferase domain-containing protein [Patescibacteria group bacterium]